MGDTNSLVQQRQPKMFQCNFASGPSPIELLGTAASGLSQINNKFTGQPIWRIAGRPLRMPERPNSFHVSAVSQYPVAGVGGTVNLGMTAVSDGLAGTRFVTMFRDSMSWDIPTAEMDADTAMQTIARFLQARHLANGGWCMLQGEWRYRHVFDAPSGVAPPPPDTAAHGSDVAPPNDDLPDDIYTNPRTSRNFGTAIPGFDAATVIRLIGGALGDTWAVEYTTDDSAGTPQPGIDARNRAWSAQRLCFTATCLPLGHAIFLSVGFGDKAGWASDEANQALHYSLDVINAALQSRVPGAILEPLANQGGAGGS